MSFQRDKIISVASNFIWRLKDFQKCRLLVVGHGRSGKDTVAEMVSRIYGYRFVGGSSWVVNPIMARLFDVTEDEAYASRHENRQVWFETINVLRDFDPLFIPKLCLQRSEIIVGTRSLIELKATVATFKPSVVMWVERDVPADPTLEFGLDEMRLCARLNGVSFTVTCNHGDLETLEQTIKFKNLLLEI